MNINVNICPNIEGGCSNPKSIEVFQQETFITSAQILSLKANPVVVVPAPGPGKAILALSGCIQLKFGTKPYVPPASGFADTFYGPSTLVATAEDVVDLAGTDNGFVTYNSPAFMASPNDYWGMGSSAAPPPVNQPVYYGLQSNASGEYTGGDSAVKITIVYVIVDMS